MHDAGAKMLINKNANFKRLLSQIYNIIHITLVCSLSQLYFGKGYSQGHHWK